MLKTTEKKTRYIFGSTLILILAGLIYYGLSQPAVTSKNNPFFRDISFYQSYNKPGQKPTVMFVVNWDIPMKKETVENPENFIIEHVKPNGKGWLPVENGKKCKINLVQYVYTSWLDTEEKRAKVAPEEREKKISQIFVNIEPEEKIDDYFRVTVKNVQSELGEISVSDEYGVIKITSFNKFIRM